MKIRKAYFAAASCILLILSIFLFVSYTNEKAEAEKANYFAAVADELSSLAGLQGKIGELHTHADFKVSIEGNTVNFSRNEFDEKNAFVHLHMDHPEDAGNVVHIEAKGMTLGHFSNPLGMKITSNCITLHNESHCNGNEKELMLFVNGTRNLELDNYIPANHDKILILYGKYNGTEIKKQINTVTNHSFNYS